ncbi:hypothetical protein JTB14_004692 [Gonioctena quinquepunctata]|nr:hypothetical protein JTB14_004692 [Gonioctena quinquepunctata]
MGMFYEEISEEINEYIKDLQSLEKIPDRAKVDAERYNILAENLNKDGEMKDFINLIGEKHYHLECRALIQCNIGKHQKPCNRFLDFESQYIIHKVKKTLVRFFEISNGSYTYGPTESYYKTEWQFVKTRIRGKGPKLWEKYEKT